VRAIGDDEVPVADIPSLGISPQHLRAVQQGMFAVVNAPGGTAAASRIADETMLFAGKTGTSQVRNISASERASGVIKNEQLPWNRRDHALFVGYAPADAPRYAVSVVVEHGGGGSAVAAPVARDAILRALSDGLPPLSAYPASQRTTIETQQKNMKLRKSGPASPESSRA
jgi:penicillin-binding protein 2